MVRPAILSLSSFISVHWLSTHTRVFDLILQQRLLYMLIYFLQRYLFLHFYNIKEKTDNLDEQLIKRTWANKKKRKETFGCLLDVFVIKQTRREKERRSNGPISFSPDPVFDVVGNEWKLTMGKFQFGCSNFETWRFFFFCLFFGQRHPEEFMTFCSRFFSLFLCV